MEVNKYTHKLHPKVHFKSEELETHRSTGRGDAATWETPFCELREMMMMNGTLSPGYAPTSHKIHSVRDIYVKA